MSRIGDASNSGNPGQEGAPSMGAAAQEVGQSLRELGGQVRAAAREKFEQLSENATSYYDQGRRATRQWEQEVESFVQEKPIQALLIAAGVGLVLGLLWK